MSAGVGDAPRGMVVLWEAATGRELRRLDRAPGAVMSVALSPDGRFLATGARMLGHGSDTRKVLTVWDIDKDRDAFAVAGAGAPARSVAFSPDGTLIAIAGLVADHAIAVWDVISGNEVRRLAGHQGRAQAIALSRDGALLATGGQDEMLRIWDVATGREVAAYRGWRAVHSVAFAPDDAFVAAGDAYGGVRVGDTATGKERYTLFGPADHTAYSLTYSADGTLLAGAFGEEYDHRGAILLWRLDPTGWRTLLAGTTGAVIYAVAASPDGHTLASAGDEDLELWDIR
jgi:WD40 repeat protein